MNSISHPCPLGKEKEGIDRREIVRGWSGRFKLDLFLLFSPLGDEPRETGDGFLSLP